MSEIFAAIGLMPDVGSMFLSRKIGKNKIFELCSIGRKIYMDEALELGLVNKAVAYEELDQTIKELTDYYISATTHSMSLMKKFLNNHLIFH